MNESSLPYPKNKRELRNLIEKTCLDMICPLPSSPDARYFQGDLADMSPEERWRESERVRDRLKYDPRPDQWFLDRLESLDSWKDDDHAY